MSIALSLLLLSAASSPIVMSHPRAPRNVVVETKAECEDNHFLFAYDPNAGFTGDGRPIRPRVIELSINGQSLPQSARDQLDDWIGNRSIQSATLYKCGLDGIRSIAVAIEFQRALSATGKRDLGVFYVHADRIEIE